MCPRLSFYKFFLNLLVQYLMFEHLFVENQSIIEQNLNI